MVVAVALAAGLVLHLDGRRDLASARAHLSERRLELAAADRATAAAASRRAEAEAGLAAVSDDLRTAQAELAARTRDRNAGEEQLGEAQARLDEVRAQLDSATLEGSLRADEVESLRECLRGVTRVLNAVAVDDVGSALAGLEAVAAACSAAEAAAVRSP